MKSPIRQLAFIALFGVCSANSTSAARAAEPANMLRAIGDLRLTTSMAAINFEEARKRYLENCVLYTETYFNKREVRNRARAAEQQYFEARVEYDRLRREQRKSAASFPLRPDTRQLSHLGRIRWPESLASEEYAKHRQELDSLFAERAGGGETGEGSRNCHSIQLATHRLLQQVQRNFGAMSGQDFVDARRFVRCLANEARSAHPADRLASN